MRFLSQEINALEDDLRGLLKGKFSELVLTYNGHACNYQTVAEAVEQDHWHGDWISDEEREKAIATNSAWTLQWYPDTPVGFYKSSASTLSALLAHCLPATREEPSTGADKADAGKD